MSTRRPAVLVSLFAIALGVAEGQPAMGDTEPLSQVSDARYF